MRKLKFHEYKLLKKADFLQWKREDNLRETRVLRRYHVQNPEVRKFLKCIAVLFSDLFFFVRFGNLYVLF